MKIERAGTHAFRRGEIVRRLMRRALLVAGALVALASSTWAASTQSVDIHVSVTVTKSLSIGTTSYNFGGLSVNTSSVSAAALLVTNDSVALIENYTLQAGNAASVGGGVPWTLASSTGTNQFALQAQFSTARPANSDSSWANDSLSATAAPCSNDDSFGNNTSGQSCFQVSPISGQKDRNLWFRIKTPDVVSDTTEHIAPVTLAVQ